jgi:hypothetical protein
VCDASGKLTGAISDNAAFLEALGAAWAARIGRVRHSRRALTLMRAVSG